VIHPRPRRVPRAEFRALPLEVHALLADVPLQDVTAIDLQGGGPGRTLADLRALVATSYQNLGSPLVRLLFALRAQLGRVFGWDGAQAAPEIGGLEIPAALAARSRAPTGTRHGPMAVLYELERESLAEGRNATVHAFLSQALEATHDGYRLYWAIYVKPVSWFTPVYMGLIEPFRRFLVYPSLLSRLSAAWAVRHAPGSADSAQKPSG
jgi:Protein of unknown function (DUF2867)